MSVKNVLINNFLKFVLTNKIGFFSFNNYFNYCSKTIYE